MTGVWWTIRVSPESSFITAADLQREAADGTLAAFRGFIRCIPEAQEKGVIYGMGTWDKGDVYRHPYACGGTIPLLQAWLSDGMSIGSAATQSAMQ